MDLAWPEARLIVEYEGAYHFEGMQISRDDERYRRLVAAGWRVIRLSAADLRDMEAVVARIRNGALGVPARLASAGFHVPKARSWTTATDAVPRGVRRPSWSVRAAYLKASLTFSPACLRLLFVWSR